MIILGRLEDFPTGGMREVEVAGNKILLVRQGDDVTAIGAICSHAGGPLAQGVLVQGRIICPWHKAAFCARTGKRLAPPAVDDVPAFPIEIQNGDIALQTPKPTPDMASASAANARRFVILGGGAAGFSAAQELRNSGFTGTIILLSYEDALPYDRTVLSKYFLSGRLGGEKTPLQNDEFYATQGIERRTARIISLDPAKKCIGLADGKELPYDAALIATGGTIVPPPFPGGDLVNVFTLRTQADAVRIVQTAAKSRHVVVIGASFIGMEVAAALRERGLDVIVVAGESARVPTRRPRRSAENIALKGPSDVEEHRGCEGTIKAGSFACACP